MIDRLDTKAWLALTSERDEQKAGLYRQEYGAEQYAVFTIASLRTLRRSVDGSMEKRQGSPSVPPA